MIRKVVDRFLISTKLKKRRTTSPIRVISEIMPLLFTVGVVMAIARLFPPQPRPWYTTAYYRIKSFFRYTIRYKLIGY